MECLIILVQDLVDADVAKLWLIGVHFNTLDEARDRLIIYFYRVNDVI